MNKQYRLLHSFSIIYANAIGENFNEVDTPTIESIENWLSECYNSTLDSEFQHSQNPFSTDNQKYFAKANTLNLYQQIKVMADNVSLQGIVNIEDLKVFYVDDVKLSQYEPFDHDQFVKAILDNYESKGLKRILYSFFYTRLPLDVFEANSLDYLYGKLKAIPEWLTGHDGTSKGIRLQSESHNVAQEYDNYIESANRSIEGKLLEHVEDKRQDDSWYWDNIADSLEDVDDFDDRDMVLAAADLLVGFEGTYNIASRKEYIEAIINE